MYIVINVEPSPYAKSKGLAKGQKHEVLFWDESENKNFFRQECFTIQPPLGKALYCFYSQEVKELAA